MLGFLAVAEAHAARAVGHQPEIAHLNVSGHAGGAKLGAAAQRALPRAGGVGARRSRGAAGRELARQGRWRGAHFVVGVTALPVMHSQLADPPLPRTPVKLVDAARPHLSEEVGGRPVWLEVSFLSGDARAGGWKEG